MRSVFTVQDILSMPYFAVDCQVVAGAEGLNKSVSWVNVLEAHDLPSFSFRGQEFVFTTGVDFSAKGVALDYLRELISENVSGLCIEATLYYKDIDQDLIDLANDFKFPLIVSTKLLPLKELVKDINSRILISDADFYKESEQFYRSLLEKEAVFSLSDYTQYTPSRQQVWDEAGREAIAAYVKYTAAYLGIDVAYWHVLTEPIYSSDQMPSVKELLPEEVQAEIDCLSENEVYMAEHIAIMKIKVLSEPYAYVIFYGEEKKMSRYSLLILRRLTLFFRSRVVRGFLQRMQKEFVLDMQWCNRLLSQQRIDTSFYTYLEKMGISSRKLKYAVLAVNFFSDGSDFLEKENISDFCLEIGLKIFRFFNARGITVAVYSMDTHMKWLLFIDENMIKDRKDYLKIFEDVKNEDWVSGKKGNRFLIGISKVFDNLSDIVENSRDAVFCSNMTNLSDEKVVIYELLYLTRILEYLKTGNLLEKFVYDYLAPLMGQENEDLLTTLRVYYDCNCSKQKAAEKLFIVRRTLYDRLEKIKHILGEDFDQGEKRVTLELALYGLKYLER